MAHKPIEFKLPLFTTSLRDKYMASLEKIAIILAIKYFLR